MNCQFKWNLPENEFERYQQSQKTAPDYEAEGGDGRYMGNVRAGNLCYDIYNWGNHIWLDCYIGGIDSGYGYKENHYPYTYADERSIKFSDDTSAMTLSDFQAAINTAIRINIQNRPEYSTFEKGTQTKRKIDLKTESSKPTIIW